MRQNPRMSVDAVPMPPSPRLRPAVALLAVLIAALQAFALAATGSIAAAAGLVATALHLAGFVGVMTRGDGAPGAFSARAFLAGMSLAASGLLAAAAVVRVLWPQAITAGAAGAVALVLAAGLGVLGASAPALRRAPGSRDPEATADPSVLLVSATGLAASAFLGAPALDASAALIVAGWLLWGGIEDLRGASR